MLDLKSCFCERATRTCDFAAVGGPSEAARVGRGAGHHGGSWRKSLRRDLWRDGERKDHTSASVSV